jgi:glycosyltransferase involved in cell wall biosynthesis
MTQRSEATEQQWVPCFTVVLNTYNRAEVLPRAMDSVLAQSFGDVELVVVDDGSIDDTASVVGAYTDPRVRYVRRKNGGLAAARNTGLAAASGEYVAFMDDDDQVVDGWLRAFAGVVGEGVGAVSCGTKLTSPDGNAVALIPQPMGPAFDDQTGLYLPGTFVVRHSVLEEIGGYYEAIRCSEQTELALRAVPECLRQGLSVESVDQALVITNRETEVNRPLRRADFLHDGALLVLERHRDRMRRDAELYANFTAIAAVQGARMGRFGEARSLLVDAITARPLEWRHYGRLAMALVPPVGRRVWGTWSPPRQASTAPRQQHTWRARVRRIPGADALRGRLRRRPPWPPKRLPVEPPTAPAEWATAAPDFVGIGAQRAGTSWWYQLIAQHPAVHVNPSVPKEVHFFDRFEERPWARESVADTYAALFPRPPGMIVGEWTPEYMVWPWCAPMLAEAGVPKLIVILRDPVERFWAGWSFSVRRGAPAVSTIAADAFHRGLYSRQMAWVLEHFERDQVLVLQYEQCIADPHAELERTFDFLGIDPSFVPDDVRSPAKQIHEKMPMPQELRQIVRSAYRADVDALVASFPEIDPMLWSDTSEVSP